MCVELPIYYARLHMHDADRCCAGHSGQLTFYTFMYRMKVSLRKWWVEIAV